MKRKYLFIQLEERNGEQEYTFRVIRDVPKDMDNESVAESIAASWYGDDSEEEDGGYMFFGGSIFVQVESVKEISKDDYDVLSKYL